MAGTVLSAGEKQAKVPALMEFSFNGGGQTLNKTSK